MRHFFSACLVAAALPRLVQAQTVFTGTVVDQQTRRPLAGAVVTAPDQPQQPSATTGPDGQFTLAGAEAPRRLRVRQPGYQPLELRVGRSGTPLTLALVPSNTDLSEVQVVGVADNRKLLDTPAALSIVTSKDFDRNNTIFLQNTLNQVSGVHMNVRSTTSQANILIRGVGTYGRFGIRGIKLYLNGIPLSDADGTTTLDDVDFTTLGRAEVIKGPASSIYGATLGGVVSLQTRVAAPGTTAYLGAVTGSYGLLRLNSGLSVGTDKMNLLVNYGHQESNGFRDEHADSRKRFLTVAGDFYLGPRQTLTVLGTYTTQHDNFAGEIDSTDLATRYPRTNPAYPAKDVGTDAEYTRLAVGYTNRLLPTLANTTSVFLASTYSLSPVEPNFAHVQRAKRGLRSVFTYTPELGKLAPRLLAGTEYLLNQDANKRYTISATGVAGALISDQEIKSSQANAFAQAEATIAPNTTLTVGASLSVVKYDNQDLVPKVAPAISQTGTRTFDPVVTPRVALLHSFGEQLAVFAQYSQGFSPPISSQISLSTGPINPDVQPERAHNYEVGTRGRLLAGRLTYDVTAFRLDVRNALVSLTDANRVTYFVNTGAARYQGVEAALSANVLAPSAPGPITAVRPFATYTFTDATYRDYKPATADYAGRLVPGTFRHLAAAGLDVEGGPGLFLNLTAQYTGRTPLLDANTRYAADYWLLGGKLGIRGRPVARLRYDAFVGFDNLTDARYAVSVAVNQATPVAGPTYYNPGLPRNFYAGGSLGFAF